MISAFVVDMRSPLPGKAWEQDAVNLDECRPEEHQQQRWKDAEDEREKKLQSDFRGRFLCALTALGAQAVGVHAQRGADARAKALGLDQHCHQNVHVLDPGAQGQVAQRFFLAGAGAQFQRDQVELLA